MQVMGLVGASLGMKVVSFVDADVDCLFGFCGLGWWLSLLSLETTIPMVMVVVLC